jgi:hypothetical protein
VSSMFIPPMARSVLNLTWFVRTWYFNTLAKSSAPAALTTEPMASKALFIGAKMVASRRALTPATRPAFVSAPASEVSPVSRAVMAGEPGIVSTVSMMWTTPPSNMMSPLVTIDIFPKPEIIIGITMLLPLPPMDMLMETSSAFWPPVTFAYGTVSIVDANSGVVVKVLDICIPVKTWYCRIAATAEGLLARFAAEGISDRSLVKAELLGARMVMFLAVLRTWAIVGTRERSASCVLVVCFERFAWVRRGMRDEGVKLNGLTAQRAKGIIVLGEDCCERDS